MEKEHKGKHKIHKAKPQKTVEKIAAVPVTPKKELPPLKPKKQEVKKSNNKNLSPFIFFVAVALCTSFFIGGVFERIVSNKTDDFKELIQGVKTSRTDESITVNEASPSAEEVVSSAVNNQPDSSNVFKTNPPEISAKAYGIFTLKDGEYLPLTSKNSDISLPPASVTKVMTAVVAIENYDLDKAVAVPEKCVGINGSSVGFKAYEVFTLQDLLYGLLVKSGADAACTIANIGNEGDFIQLMNDRAKELGMENTSFTNSIGFDNPSHLSNVEDIKILVSHALKFSTFRQIVGYKEAKITAKDTRNTYVVKNTNDLLFTIPGTVGIKTGYTDSARECLAYLYQNKTDEIMIIILGSEDRFGDTSKLLEWAKTEIASN